jgi:KDO2-lipid IV(A) lauroyltransferase
MNKKIKKISNLFLTIFFLILRFFSLISTAKNRTIIGKFFGSIGFFLMKNRRKIAIKNLTFAFPEKPTVEITKIAKGSFQNLGITFFELFAMSSLSDDELRKMIDFGDGLDLINTVNSRGKGMMFLSGHFGNWELIAYSVGVFTNLPITIIVKPQANEFADKFLNRYRTSRGNKIVSMYNAAKTIITVVKNKETIALLADQSATKNKDVFVDFFGYPASTFKVVGELAIRYQIPIIMGVATRQPNGKYKAELVELKYDDLENSLDGVYKLTERHTKLLEDFIRKAPEQWAWMHNRWKYSRNG